MSKSKSSPLPAGTLYPNAGLPSKTPQGGASGGKRTTLPPKAPTKSK